MRIVALIFLISCGNSPLFHHLDAADFRPNEDTHSHDENCPLEFHKAKLCASLGWLHGPSGQDENDFTLKFWDSVKRDPAGPYVDPAEELFVQLWMPSMGHGSSPTKIDRVSVGVYHVSSLYFVMPGDWEIRLQLRHARQLTEQVVLAVKVP